MTAAVVASHARGQSAVVSVLNRRIRLAGLAWPIEAAICGSGWVLCNGVSNHGGPRQGTFFVLRQREMATVPAITPNASTTGTEISDSACILLG